MKHSTKEEKYYRVLVYLNEKFEIVPDYDWIEVNNDDLKDVIRPEDFVAIIDTLVTEQVIELKHDWFEVNNGHSLSARFYKLDEFDAKFNEAKKAIIKVSHSKNIDHYELKLEGNLLVLIANNALKIKIKKLNAGKNKDFLTYMFKNPNTLITKDMLEEIYPNEYKDEKLSQFAFNNFNIEGLITLAFPVKGVNEIMFKPRFTSDDLERLNMTMLDFTK